jgi:putative tricarboxylic transport membrane protein
MIAFVGNGSKVKALLMGVVGLIIATIGIDPISASSRLSFGSEGLSSGINIVAMAVGLFGLSEVFNTIYENRKDAFVSGPIGRLLPTKADLLLTRFAMLRASIIGFIIGVLPGGGGVVSSVVAYGAEKRFSKNPEKFGKGAMDGLAATETADNASSNAAFIPLLTLGIPSNPVLALIFGALLLQNISPGPQLINSHPDIFWGVIASMYIGNVLLIIFNIPLIGVFVQLLRIKPSVLTTIIVTVAMVGVYSSENSVFDLWIAAIFGVIGFVLKRMDFDLGPLILGFILGGIIEVQFRRSMLLSDGSLMIFLERPVSLVLILILGAIVATTLYGSLKLRKKTAELMEDVKS